MAKKTSKEIASTAQKNASPVVAGSEDKNRIQFSLLTFRTQAIILAMLGLLFYCNTFSHESAFDDRMAIEDNEYVQQGVSGIPDILTKDAYQSYLEHKNGSNQLAGGRYRPLSLITFAIEQQFLGISSDESPLARQAKLAQDMHTRHVVNVLLYMLSVALLLYFLRSVVFPTKPLVAFLAALLFTIHPVHTEVVANVKSRDEILSMLFICITFIQAFKYKDTKKTGNLMLALASFFLALLSKEYAITLVALLPLSFYLLRKESITGSVKTTLPYLAPLALYLLMRFNAVTAMADGAENSILNNPYLFATGGQKLATELLVLLNYLKLLIFPNVLAADYSYNQIPYTGFSNPFVWLSLALHLAMVAGMFVLIRKRHVLTFALAIYLANLLLISNLLFNIGAPMGERLIYHSSMGFAIAAAYILHSVFERIRPATFAKAGLAGFMAIIILLCGFKTIDRNEDWKNDKTLFLADVKTVPNSIRVNNNAAASCMSFAKENAADITLRNEWFQKAISYFDKTLSIYPGHTLARLNRGLCYFNMGMPEKALPDWDTVRKYAPNEQNLSKYLSVAGKYFYNEGTKYEKANKLDSAIYEFSKCTEAVPELADGWYFLGRACFEARRMQEAKIDLAQAIKIAPNFADAKRLYEQAVRPEVSK